MQLFYSEYINDNGYILLSDQEAKHCAQVLRKKVGDSIYVTDGKGNLYTASLTEVGKKNCLAKIETHTTQKSTDYYLHIAIAPTKNIGRTEWFLEKAIEFGVHEITFLSCQRSERKQIKLERMQKIAIVAMKQSLNLQLPKLNEMVAFSSFVKTVKEWDGQMMIAHCDAKPKPWFLDLLQPNHSALVCIGPEGDFTAAEVEMAISAGCREISLGNSRLRTETAGIAVSCMTYSLNHNSVSLDSAIVNLIK